MHALAVEKGQTLICAFAVSKSCAIVCCVHTHDHRKKVKAKTNMNYDVVRNTEETCASIVVIQLFAWKKRTCSDGGNCIHTHTELFFPPFLYLLLLFRADECVVSAKKSCVKCI